MQLAHFEVKTTICKTDRVTCQHTTTPLSPRMSTPRTLGQDAPAPAVGRETAQRSARLDHRVV